MERSVYEAAGGAPALQRLAAAWHHRCLADPVVSHAFAHPGLHPQHVERLAIYWGEALGGTPGYTASLGDHSHVLRLHSGNGEHAEMDRRAARCFAQALDDAGLPDDPRLRRTLTDWWAWMTAVMDTYPHSADDVPPGLPLPAWSWDGPVAAGGMRLVSLLPSATEIVYALGLGDQLVGVTFECDEPPSARAEKTVVVGGVDTKGMTPREIDDYVRGQLSTDGNLYTLHEQALADLRPDLILTQDLCRVCALPSGDVEAALDYLGCTSQVLTLDPRTLDEVLDSILTVGQATGATGQAERLVAALRERLAQVAARVAGRPPPRVVVLEWVDPPFTGGHWVPDLVTAAGGTPVAARPGAPSVAATWPEIAAAAPDLAVVAPCGYHLDGAAEQARAVAGALPGVPVWAIDADAIVVRPGPRLVTGVEALAAILHPGAAAPAPSGTTRRVA